jgi:hypothetical protein
MSATNRAAARARDPLHEAARTIRNASERKRRRGDLVPLGINPETGKRYSGTGRYPVSGNRSPILKLDEPLPPLNLEGRFQSRRERAAGLRERMGRFSAIYNAAWLVRHAYFGPSERQREAVMQLIGVLLQELRATNDYEACLFAVADALYASPLGVPWEP